MVYSLDFQPFGKISNSQLLTKVLHAAVDDLIGRKQIKYDDCENSEWTEKDFNTAVRTIQSLYKECLSKDSFELDAPELSQNVLNAIKSCYDIRSQEIFNWLVRQTIISQGHTLTDNYDWKLKWVIGSSKVASLREPILQVDLYCSEKKENDVKSVNVNFETTLDKLDMLINELDRVLEQ